MDNTSLERAAHHAINDIQDAYNRLIAEIEELEQENKALQQQIEVLKEQLSEYENGAND